MGRLGYERLLFIHCPQRGSRLKKCGESIGMSEQHTAARNWRCEFLDARIHGVFFTHSGRTFTQSIRFTLEELRMGTVVNSITVIEHAAKDEPEGGTALKLRSEKLLIVTPICVYYVQISPYRRLHARVS